jgi:hypothetical protein
MSTLMDGPTVGVVHMVVVVAAVWAMVVTVSLLMLSLPSNMLNMFCIAYPFCPDVLHSANAMMHHPYTSWKNVLRAGYVLAADAFHMSNLLRGKMLAWKRMRMVFAMI